MMEVQLQYYNLPVDLTALGPEKVSVRLWGSFKGSSSMVAYVDLSGLDKGVYQIPVKLKSVQGAMFTSVQPNKVEVRLEALSERAVDIKYEVKQNPQAGYQLAEVLLSPNHCLIKGDADVLGRIAGVFASVDLGAIKDIASVKSSLQARDANGKVISDGIQIVPSTVDAYVVVEKKQITKMVDIKTLFSSTIPEGFTIGEIKSDPLQVTILGDQMRVEALSEILTKPIDITGKQEDFTLVVDLVQPEGVIIVPTKATIQVKISKSVVKGVQ
jgi:YbbR domain-containing protein